MNRRQQEKHFKRKWCEVFSKLMFCKVGVKVKPSRIKLHVSEDGKDYHFIGQGGGYTFDIHGTLKEKEAE